MSASAKLAELGIELPEVVPPLAAYVPAARTGNLVFTAGQLPMESGSLIQTGKVGGEVTPADGKALARVCALNALAAVHSLVGIDSVTRVVEGVELPLRRSRGYAPRPLELPLPCPRRLLAVGGQLKATFALGRGRSGGYRGRA